MRCVSSRSETWICQCSDRVCRESSQRARRGLKFSPGCSSEWFLKAAGAPAKTHTDPHSSALCDQPWTVEGVLLQQRGGGDRKREEEGMGGGLDGDSGIPPRITWPLSKAFISSLYFEAGAPLYCFSFELFLKSKPDECDAENIHKWRITLCRIFT